MEKDELVDRAMALFKKLGHLQMRYALEPWRKLDVPLAQLKSLFLINVSGSLTVRNLAQKLGVTPGDVTSIVDRLVGQGLLQRADDPGDRRLVLLHLTEKGRKLITDIHLANMGRMHDTLGRMAREDIEALCRGMGSLVAVVEADSRDLPADQDRSSVTKPLR